MPRSLPWARPAGARGSVRACRHACGSHALAMLPCIYAATMPVRVLWQEPHMQLPCSKSLVTVPVAAGGGGRCAAALFWSGAGACLAEPGGEVLKVGTGDRGRAGRDAGQPGEGGVHCMRGSPAQRTDCSDIFAHVPERQAASSAAYPQSHTLPNSWPWCWRRMCARPGKRRRSQAEEGHATAQGRWGRDAMPD